MTNVCFAPGCKTGYKSDRARNVSLGLKNPSLFKAPNELPLLEQWRRAVPRKDKILQSTHKLCEIHFDEECIERAYETKMPDGSVHVLVRERPRLKPGSIPTKFPNLPKYFSKSTPKRKAPAPRSNLSACKKIHLNVEGCEQSSEHASECEIQESISITQIGDKISDIDVPDKWWPRFQRELEHVIFIKFTDDILYDRHVVIHKDLTVKVFLKNIELAWTNTIESLEDISALLQDVDKLVICKDIDSRNRKSDGCLLHVSECDVQNHGGFCRICDRRKNTFVSKEKKRILSLTKQKVKLSLERKYALRKNHRLLKKVSVLKEKIKQAMLQCSQKKEDVLDAEISCLPPQQQVAVKTCFAASKLKNKRSIRYTIDWIYECLLLRIKSKKAYEHVRSHDILMLPSSNTLFRYLRKIKGSYGFQSSIFSCLQKKASLMKDCERRGVVLVDEMKLSEAVNFNKKSLQVEGFVNLGQYTPKEQKTKIGDHALVFMFQPFRGKWVQALACFLSKGAASGAILQKLLVECVILLEKAGYFVDAIISDGASWNRSMWNHFGINDSKISIPHIFDENRRLWFISDFPHLIKNLRNAVSSKKQMMTHQGLINTKYWEAIVERDNPKGYNLKACPNLSFDAIYPKNFQKMNVPMAFQFFSQSVISAMELYKDEHLGLEGCEPCIEILKIISSGIRAMNSRTPVEALRPNSSEEKAIQDFLSFMKNWEVFAKSKDYHFISESTCFGLKVTLSATIEIVAFLAQKCGFDYLMTSRLNQDSLERFFGMMRDASGANDHPDSQTFLQLYRLLSAYSLVKPPKGSSVSGSEVLSSLLNTKDMMQNRPSKAADELTSLLDRIIEKGASGDDSFHDEIEEAWDDHNYDMIMSSDFVITYVAGYVVRRTTKFTTCDDCVAALTSNNPQDETHRLIELKSRGHLLYPDKTVVTLIVDLENTILNTVRTNKMHSELLFNIMDKISNGPPLTLVGCINHKHSVTEKIIRFYLLTRMCFLCNIYNKNHNSSDTKKLRKYSKM